MSKKSGKANPSQHTLVDSDISTTSFKGRRSFIRSLGLGVGAAAAALHGESARARDPVPRNDADGGPYQLPDKKKPRDND